jgi:S-formylglutathione hydrolase FrmB
MSGAKVALVGLTVIIACHVATGPAPLGSARNQGGSLRLEEFFSSALGASKRYLIYLPPSYRQASRQRYPVVYVLHGATGNEADWVARGDLDRIADSVFVTGLPELILVMPDGDNSFWANWAISPGYQDCARNAELGEAATTFCVASSRYGDYLAGDLVAHVDSAYRTLGDRAHRGVMGLSMGGTGALTLALTYQGTFSATAALSAVAAPFYIGPHPYRAPARQATSFDELDQALGGPQPGRRRYGTDTALWSRYDPERAARALQRSGGPLPAIRIDVGRDDPYIDQNRALDAALTALGVPHEYYERAGAHQWVYWRTHTASTLVWLAGHLARPPSRREESAASSGTAARSRPHAPSPPARPRER